MTSQTIRLSDNQTGKHKRTCRNRPAATDLPGYMAQDGWKDGKRVMVKVDTPWNDIACGHDERASDEACGNCEWRLAQ